MARKTLAELRPGEVVSQDVYNLQGQRLCTRGTVLTDRQIGVLRTFGVSAVDVVPPGTDLDAKTSGPSAGTSEEAFARATERVEALFAHNDLEHPVVAEMVRIAARKRAERDEKAP